MSRNSKTTPPPATLADDWDKQAKALREIAARILAQANDLEEVAKQNRLAYGVRK